MMNQIKYDHNDYSEFTFAHRQLSELRHRIVAMLTRYMLAGSLSSHEV